MATDYSAPRDTHDVESYFDSLASLARECAGDLKDLEVLTEVERRQDVGRLKWCCVFHAMVNGVSTGS
jgi:hypothetical protein